MVIRLILAFLHLLTLGIGFYAIWTRANALKKLTNTSGLAEVFRADNLWGLASMLWIGTGVWRAFGGLEKGSAYYLHSTAFLVKMGLFLLVFLLEVKIMVTLIRWRSKSKKGELIDFTPARSFAFKSHLQLGILSIIVLLATMMARGIWN